uniref:Zinc finger DHHC-type palmitoyltransferase 15 n=2 Tax=Cercopithecinae TaxID=9528 RepID=A0A096NB37_PAPAN
MRRGWKMALSGGLRCCRRVLSWVPVLVIVLVVLWSYYAYVFELCLVTVLSPAEKVIYLIFYHAIFVFFTWTYWKSIFTLPQQPNQKFHLSYTDKERYENEERPEVQKQMLVDMAKKLPVYTRTGSGEAFCTPVFTSGPEKNGFNLGFIKNIQQVFGDKKKFWLIPIGSSPGDGHSFPMRSMNESQNPLLANEEPWEDNEDDNQDYPEGSSSLAVETET